MTLNQNDMENSKALRIIKILADGVDPTTGEVFDQNSPYQNPDVIRALLLRFPIWNDKRIVNERRVDCHQMQGNRGTQQKSKRC